MIRSTKGLLFGCPLGVPKTSTKSSFSNLRWPSREKDSSKERMGRLPFIQFPVILSSSMVWILETWNLTEGPPFCLPNHKYASCRFRHSRNKTVLQPLISAISVMARPTPSWPGSNLDSFLWCGINVRRSSSRWRNRAVIPREQEIRHLCLLR